MAFILGGEKTTLSAAGEDADGLCCLNTAFRHAMYHDVQAAQECAAFFTDAEKS